MIILREFLGGRQELNLAVEQDYNEFCYSVFGEIMTNEEVMDKLDDMFGSLDGDFPDAKDYILNDDQPEFIERYSIAWLDDDEAIKLWVSDQGLIL
jgi:hypothetical protein